LARLWWVQNVLVPQAANYGHVPQALRPLSEAILGWAPGTPWPSMTPALFGGEMRPPGLARLAADFWYVAAAPLAMGAMLALRRRPGREAVLATVVAAGFTMLLVRHERFAEYAAPWWALALALWPWPRLAWRPVLPAAVVLLAAAVAVQAARAGNALGYLGPGVFRPCGDWMAGQPELRDAVVYNHSWDAFSELFFYRPDASYMVGLDPMFAVARGTENSRRWLLLMQGRAGEVAPDGPGLVRVLRDDFGAQYLFVHRLTSQRFFDQTLQMARSGQLEVAFDGRGQGCMLYRLPRAP
ncbi:MAG: hypothetical protein KJ044_08905, partial [Planctomycetes bacterium]|nr:hypothetical protein [Planctomycetota bacterium]